MQFQELYDIVCWLDSKIGCVIDKVQILWENLLTSPIQSRCCTACKSNDDKKLESIVVSNAVPLIWELLDNSIIVSNTIDVLEEEGNQEVRTPIKLSLEMLLDAAPEKLHAPKQVRVSSFNIATDDEQDEFYDGFFEFAGRHQPMHGKIIDLSSDAASGSIGDESSIDNILVSHISELRKLSVALGSKPILELHEVLARLVEEMSRREDNHILGPKFFQKKMQNICMRAVKSNVSGRHFRLDFALFGIWNSFPIQLRRLRSLIEGVLEKSVGGVCSVIGLTPPANFVFF